MMSLLESRLWNHLFRLQENVGVTNKDDIYNIFN